MQWEEHSRPRLGHLQVRIRGGSRQLRHPDHEEASRTTTTGGILYQLTPLSTGAIDHLFGRMSQAMFR